MVQWSVAVLIGRVCDRNKDKCKGEDRNSSKRDIRDRSKGEDNCPKVLKVDREFNNFFVQIEYQAKAIVPYAPHDILSSINAEYAKLLIVVKLL